MFFKAIKLSFLERNLTQNYINYTEEELMLIEMGVPMTPPTLPFTPPVPFFQIISQAPPWDTREPWKTVCKLLPRVRWLEVEHNEIRKCHLSPSFALRSFMVEINTGI